MRWSTEAREIGREVLRRFSAVQREAIKESFEERAVELAEDEGEDEVSMETAVLALIQATPPGLHEHLKNALAFHGVDPEDYDSAFAEAEG